VKLTVHEGDQFLLTQKLNVTLHENMVASPPFPMTIPISLLAWALNRTWWWEEP